MEDMRRSGLTLLSLGKAEMIVSLFFETGLTNCRCQMEEASVGSHHC